MDSSTGRRPATSSPGAANRRGRGAVASAACAVALALTAACSSGDDRARRQDAPSPALPSSTAPSVEPAPTPSATATPTATPTPAPDPVSLPAYFDRPFRGGDLRLGRVRERTSSYTSYDVSYRSEGLRISGVLNVPRGQGPFPAVVLAHGYIDPDVYVRGQGMTRERGRLADAGYIALHVDYRNHAASDDDPALDRTARLGYAVDVVNAVNALRASDDVPVDDARLALMGRSMGGGVVYQALEMAPGLVGAAVVFASVSTDERDNAAKWGRDMPSTSDAFFAGVSPRTYLDRITEPVLIHHGRQDTTCPPGWTDATYRALGAAGVEAQLLWYDGEGHAFGPKFDLSMRRSVAFLAEKLTG